ncbi:TIGR04222 domain-containing membrane protein [Solwaraspora sp. WMMD406]|uniref:TIGR04222 domain-containing membrane protein n=1 Tax=Solwaraspora sp. WMMD406 TaxID=3016095 RepID=UPI0024174616|nr:TIGR04222 domain-containing membrane protein [Solwaraspora sp. WMMD406]MDG4765559.1 TIGR04222 domain-containing membrane protein [Solwaraspora sp. WMMD406]
MAADTWGIPGPLFLQMFGLAALGLFVANLVFRRTVLGGRDVVYSTLTGAQVAFLNGGERLARYATLAKLRNTGAIAMAHSGHLATAGPLPVGATDLDRAVYHAATNQVRARDLATDHWVAQSVQQLREGLETAGLAVTGPQRRTARRLAAAMLVLAAVGVVRLVAGIANGRPIGYLLLLLAVTVPVGLVLWFTVPRTTRTGRSALRNMRNLHSYLAPARKPAYSSYGADGAAMGVGLFGAMALWSMDPAFAAEAEIERTSTGGGDGGGGSDGGGDGGGGGCGGGGCGGGCGG